MNTFQRTIKYIAIAFAVLLAVGIISAIASLVVNVVSAVTGRAFFGKRDTIDFSRDFENVRSLDIDNEFGDMSIKVGNTFRVEAEEVIKGFHAEVESDGTLTIDEENNHFSFLWFDFHGFGNFKSKVTVYIPEDFAAEKVELESGMGNMTIDALNAEYLDINAGAGNISGYNINADEVKLEGGIGNVSLSEVHFINSDIDCGLGNLNITGRLLGENNIDCGIGDVNLNLTGSEEDYDIKVDSGIGDIRVNGDKLSEGFHSRSGAENSLLINGGLGDVRINFKD